MVEDTPDDKIHDFFESLFWRGHPLGLPILGTKERIEAFRRDELLHFFQTRYRGRHLVLTAAGNLKHNRFVDLVRRSFGSLRGSSVCELIEVPVARPGKDVLRNPGPGVPHFDGDACSPVVGTLLPSASPIFWRKR